MMVGGVNPEQCERFIFVRRKLTSEAGVSPIGKYPQLRSKKPSRNRTSRWRGNMWTGNATGETNQGGANSQRGWEGKRIQEV